MLFPTFVSYMRHLSLNFLYSFCSLTGVHIMKSFIRIYNSLSFKKRKKNEKKPRHRHWILYALRNFKGERKTSNKLLPASSCFKTFLTCNNSDQSVRLRYTITIYIFLLSINKKYRENYWFKCWNINLIT